MTCTALEKFEEDHGFKFRKITKIPLEGDGTIERKVAKYVSVYFRLAVSCIQWLTSRAQGPCTPAGQ